ncbi:hypothetical protein JXB02_04780 [Candidatus Woesearchaeota archaeon]|nr:hypothetical protein [Candidatus Woesearchaeota archaeon]
MKEQLSPTLKTQQKILELAMEDEEKKHKTIQRDEVKRFTFADFAQGVIGAGVFGLPAFINTSFWDYLPLVSTGQMLVLHLFFLFCVVTALNFKYRSTFSFNPKFLAALAKRFSYIYLSVFVTVILLLIILNKMTADISTLLLIRYFLAGQSVGIVGATTFSFFTKE